MIAAAARICRLGALALALGVTVTAPAAGRGSAAGVFTEAQAQDGARIYAVRCAVCHGATLAGTLETPGLRGRFVANWAGRPLADLFDYVTRAMPQMAPGTLSADDNARIVAFLLAENGAPAGRRPLPADAAALARIRFDPTLSER